MREADRPTQRGAYFCRLYTEATLGGMAFELIERPADDAPAALLAATQGSVPVRSSTPDERYAALNVIAADFAVHLGAVRGADEEATAAELRAIGDRWLAHVIHLVTEATAPMRPE
jgi:hypothetical protein